MLLRVNDHDVRVREAASGLCSVHYTVLGGMEHQLVALHKEMCSFWLGRVLATVLTEERQVLLFGCIVQQPDNP
jgi:hypothetical protein